MAFELSAFGIDNAALPVGWSARKLEDLAEFNPEQITASYPYERIAYLDISNVDEGTFGEPICLSIKDAPSRARRIVVSNDTIMSTVRPGNRAYAYLQNVPDNLIASTGFAVLRAKEGMSAPRFLYYLVTSNPIIDYLTSIAEEKTAYPSVNPSDISECVVPVPSISEQHRIADVLGSFDDKIELNRWMNKTLKEMAEAIFKSWFIDFDPVHAKAAGYDTGLPKQIAEIFPDSFEESRLGKIPKGWTVCKIEDVADRVGMGPFGSSIKVETFVPDGIPIISGQHLNSFMMEDNVFRFITSEHASVLKSANVQRGDVVFTHAGNIGQVAFIPDNSRYDKYVLSQRQFFMRCNQIKVTPSFIALYFKTREGQHKLLANASSSGVPSIARPVTYLRSVSLVVPTKSVLDAFSDIVQDMFLDYRAKQEETNLLCSMRDTLLPVLLSGKLQVRGKIEDVK